MYNLLTEEKLDLEVEKIFKSAKKYLIIVSPKTQLSENYKSALLKQVKNKKLEITILFGDVNNELSENLKNDTIDFFKQFPNIEVLIENRLREKYYANESKAIFSSTKLPYVKNNDLETAVLIEKKNKNNVVDKLDNDYSKYFNTIIDKATLLFRNEPNYEKKIVPFKTNKNMEDIYEIITPNKNGSYHN